MKESKNFIENIIDEDLASGLDQSLLKFRFPPEPNGFLHIGHVKAICVNFSLAKKYKAPVVLRFDDTNPVKEEQQYIDAIKNDISWLGFKWDEERFASDYFEQLYNWALELIKNGKAYVDSQSSTLMAEQKGTPTSPGENSIYRDRPIEENIRLFNEMRQGVYAEGKHVLRAKISMNANNMLLRDPVIYRVIKKEHPRTGSNWVVYPLYDWAHGESDYIEQISHSLCTLEFKPHRELYNWFLKQIADPNKLKPKQREFARLNLSHTITSKRKLMLLVSSGVVSGWDDPRMPTISGLRRRGYPPVALQEFVRLAGVAKRENIIEASLLEFCAREELNKTSNRVMVVLDPLKLTITNYPSDTDEMVVSENNPENPLSGEREMPFGKEIFIEKEDFKPEANRKFFRLTIGKEVRLKSAYIIKANELVYDDQNNVVEVLCTYDPKSKSGSGSEESQRKVKGTLHWVSKKGSVDIKVNEYDRLFEHSNPASAESNEELLKMINPNSSKTSIAKAEPFLSNAQKGDRFQFQRKGYFIVDNNETPLIVFNKTVGLRDNWKK
ncbi:glutamine--tRNA ligase/YqeY domain fusion protein [Flavobacteriaceae bacterium]|nr:glutamine--tRNA ligase/YqeY domain fusion protein [Flavobacteriaceae bacterium]MDA9176605.1 glutamine--tRNA ligase/YqeY domain fusion protein [Flavobacteriaceae bacterium]MDB3874837.1 glutamine--tRNA ligase/YqeY domain fusion protein [Flavobacteriaceae bacterium]MDB4601911.1 glutamine--tRNA ligase/YqeY domain fusion protein [Flavobacteriaceae bacterium]MDC0554161.1 glutamine--tRNA ligase/YqeY domain fusion protein [Flavobacteriaceae bacterium]